MAETIGSIQFLKWQSLYETEKPFSTFADIDPDADDQRLTNLVFESQNVPINDLRKEDTTFTLDANGFKVAKLPSFQGPLNEDAIKSICLPQVERLIRNEMEDVRLVEVFDWRLCQSSTSRARS